MTRDATDLAYWTSRAAEAADALYGPPARPLAELVAELSATYTRRRADIAGTVGARDALQARLRFFFVRDLAKVARPLAAVGPRLGTHWRVLDLGAGVGTTGLGAAREAAARGWAASFRVTAVDRDREALQAYARLAAHAPLPFELDTRAGDARRNLPNGPFDLVLLGLVLNELGAGAREELMAALAARLRPGGAVVVVEPALRPVTRALMSWRNALVETGWRLLAPCPHAGPCPMLARERDWCHDEFPQRLPPALAEVAREAGLRFERSTSAYLVLARDGAPPAGDRVVSQPLVSKGKRELWLCRPDRTLVTLRRLDRHRSPANAALDELRRYDRIHAEGELRKGALRVDADARIDLLSG